MKRLTGLALLVLMIGTTTTMLTATAEDRAAISDRERHCRYGSLEDAGGGVRTWSEREIRLTIRCAASRWGVDYGTAIYIAERESGLNPAAVNPSSGTCGLFQHIPSYWPGRIAALNRTAPALNAGPSCFNARSNALASIRMMATAGFSPWAATAP